MDGNTRRGNIWLVALFGILVLFAIYLYSQKQQKTSGEKMLVGTWEYEKSIDEKGNEIDEDLSNTLFSVNGEGTAELSFEGLLTVDCRWEYIRQNQEGSYYQIHVIGNSESGTREEDEKNIINEAKIVSEKNEELGGRLCITNEDLPGAILVFEKVNENPTELTSLSEVVDDFMEDMNSIFNEDEEGQATLGEQNALGKAYEYLNAIAFSYDGLIEQLEYEGFSNSEATYAADHCGADWKEQAARKAQEYLNIMSFSRSSLIDQLEYEGFTREQAIYGAEENGL